MKTLVIRRNSTGGHGTFGALLYDDIPFALTLERQWLGNRKSVSCIPAGVYQCLRCSNSPDYNFNDSPRFGDTFQVMNVPGRSNILFHAGNLDDDSHGCILIGEKYDKLNGDPGILSSNEGFNEFKELLDKDDEFRLIIVDDYKNELVKEQ